MGIQYEKGRNLSSTAVCSILPSNLWNCQILNQFLSHDDKLDFISCVFEVAYADGELHYLEHHAVKKIANILHLEKNEIISAKAEIESYLD